MWHGHFWTAQLFKTHSSTSLVQGEQHPLFMVGTEYKGRDLKGTHLPLKALKGHLWLLQSSPSGIEHVLDIYVPDAVSAVCHYE